MEKTLIVANWKANKTQNEAVEFFEKFSNEDIDLENKEVIVCPPFTLLAKVSNLVLEKNLKISVGAQDVSRFDNGAYTGEVTAQQVKEFGSYVLIGHSERRKNFSEGEDMLSDKVASAISVGLSPIFCVSDSQMTISQQVKIVAYEPISAIGTGNPDTVEDASRVASEIKSKNKNVEAVLYGGSISADNVSSFVLAENIDGVLVGGASLDPSSFAQIIKNA